MTKNFPSSVGGMRCRACRRDAESVVRRDEARCVGCNGRVGDGAVALALCDACKQPHAYWCGCSPSADWAAGVAAGRAGEPGGGHPPLDWLGGYEAGMRSMAR